jgi:ABC-type lipoprotein release transport system permease subunit
MFRWFEQFLRDADFEVRNLLKSPGFAAVAGLSLASRIPDFPRFAPWSFGAVSLILPAAGLQACYWPARRAARVDPVAALRYE